MLERKNQTGGNSSINIQSEKDVNLNIGITYSEARKIALDIFEANFLQLSKNASELAFARTRELTEEYIKKLYDTNPALLQSAEDPDMQYGLFTAQKEYARTGDKVLGDLLVDILVDRAAQKERSVLQIVNNEALIVAPKLTVEQYNVLSLIFILRYTKRININDFNEFQGYYKKIIATFTENIRTDEACFQHLEYAGCGTLQLLSVASAGSIFQNNYPGLFWNGALQEEIDVLKDQNLTFTDLFIPCLNAPEKFQFSALNNDVLRNKCTNAGLTEDKYKLLVDFQNKHLMSDQDIQKKVTEAIPSSLPLFELWSNSPLGNFTLTSVGIAIGHANLRRRTNEEYKIGIWIK